LRFVQAENCKARPTPPETKSTSPYGTLRPDQERDTSKSPVANEQLIRSLVSDEERATGSLARTLAHEIGICALVSDRANRKLLILPDGLISVRGAWWWTGILFIASAALSVLAGWQFLVIWAISGIIGFLYSDLPNLKGLPIPNITMNMLGYGTVAFAVKFAYRVASFTLALFVGVRFPVFALLAALSWAGARAYYWLRFGIKVSPGGQGGREGAPGQGG